MEKIEEILIQIFKELEYHGKLLSEIVITMDERKKEQMETKTDIGKQIKNIGKMMEGSPFASALTGLGEKMEGKHGD